MNEATFPLPSEAELPAADAPLRDIIRFANAHDPTLWLQNAWGAEYRAKALKMWESYVTAFKMGKEAPPSGIMILLALNFDIAAGPYMGRSPEGGSTFHGWLIDGLRRAL